MSLREEEEPPRIIDHRASHQPQQEQSDEGDEGRKENVTEEQQAASLEDQLRQERQRAESNLASWQRAAADYQNLKRRVEQEREEFARLGNASLVINLLPLLDDLERALGSVDARLAGLTWLDGIRLIHRKFQALLEMSGVSEIQADGQQFDPNLHEAVMYSDGEEGKVMNVVQKGYKLNGRVLRPAMVVVGNGSSRPDETQ
jgi:molecular chaperone GrpE